MACARYGTSYVASIFFAAEERAASTSPSLRTRLALPPSATAACMAALSFALVSSFGPSHLTSSASRPFMAAQVDVAMTPGRYVMLAVGATSSTVTWVVAVAVLPSASLTWRPTV